MGESGDKGWYDRGYPPHYSAAGFGQSLTFRLFDSLPSHVLQEWEREVRALPEERQGAERLRRVGRFLDQSAGSCWLRRPDLAKMVDEAIRFGHGSRYTLLAWCVMPNHVHLALTETEAWPWFESLESLKKFTARRANEMLGRTGRFWFRDNFNRYLRDPAHRLRTITYIEENPVKAGLCRSP